jgi:hypothetical protein
MNADGILRLAERLHKATFFDADYASKEAQYRILRESADELDRWLSANFFERGHAPIKPVAARPNTEEHFFDEQGS